MQARALLPTSRRKAQLGRIPLQRNTWSGHLQDLSRGYFQRTSGHTTLERGPQTKEGLEGHSCEACHGPGAAHVEDADPKKIFSFKTATAKEINQRCLECHSSGKDHMNFSRSAHSEQPELPELSFFPQRNDKSVPVGQGPANALL